MSALQPEPKRSELELAVQRAVAEQWRFSQWPPVLKQDYGRSRESDARQVLYHLQVIGLIVAILSIAIDVVALSDQAMRGALLRGLLVIPPALLGVIFAKRWSLRPLKLVAGMSIVAFGTITVHLASLADPVNATRYTMATTFLLGMAGLLLPFVLDEAIAFMVAFCTATLAIGLWPNPLPAGLMLEHLVMTLIVAGAILAIAIRNGELRARTYLYAVRDKFIQGELEQTVQVLRELSEKDGLTGLANRRAFRSVFLQTYANPPPEELSGVSLLMIDLDHFKAFNDNYGHPAGDRALRAVARCLDHAFNAHGGHVARFGGEEFIGALHCHTIADAESFAELVCHEIRALKIPVRRDEAQSVTASIGVASTGAGAKVDLCNLTARADRALYHAKETGRDQVVLSERIELRVDRLAS
ncbi:GGDEF domain-containing protein [Parerythrobacter aestuarii]|uniref:GGDEF domain-containing protein n=1 Tax=Parerythrobacter aestuarii TaxID=3020909 RepID=UPI0024DE1546|nr:sensor domain-containing diguanylate cyclase [Parerythrobacter aestuarii]